MRSKAEMVQRNLMQRAITIGGDDSDSDGDGDWEPTDSMRYKHTLVYTSECLAARESKYQPRLQLEYSLEFDDEYE